MQYCYFPIGQVFENETIEHTTSDNNHKKLLQETKEEVAKLEKLRKEYQQKVDSLYSTLMKRLDDVSISLITDSNLLLSSMSELETLKLDLKNYEPVLHSVITAENNYLLTFLQDYFNFISELITTKEEFIFYYQKASIEDKQDISNFFNYIIKSELSKQLDHCAKSENIHYYAKLSYLITNYKIMLKVFFKRY